MMVRNQSLQGSCSTFLAEFDLGSHNHFAAWSAVFSPPCRFVPAQRCHGFSLSQSVLHRVCTQFLIYRHRFRLRFNLRGMSYREAPVASNFDHTVGCSKLGGSPKHRGKRCRSPAVSPSKKPEKGSVSCTPGNVLMDTPC